MIKINQELAVDVVSSIKRNWVWLVVFAAPLLIDVILWNGYTGANLSRHQELKKLKFIMEQKPKIESLLSESNALLSSWGAETSAEEGMTQVVGEIQKLADQHKIQVNDINVSGTTQQAGKVAKGFTQQSVNLDAVGDFNHLVQWIHALEGKIGLSINNWNLSADQQDSKKTHLNLNLEIMLRKSS